MTGNTLKRVHLQLAEADGAASGSGNSYELHLPLLVTGALDVTQWQSVREDCRVIRHNPHHDDCIAQLRPFGQASLIVDFSHCDGVGTTQTQLYFDRLIEGSYISIRESDGLLRTFSIASVTNATTPHGFATR